jgi:hypothetical protein
MKSQKKTLRNHNNNNNKADTSFELGDLFSQLREHPAEPAIKRVENVLRLMVAADTLAREQREQMRLHERSGKDPHRSKSFMESLDESARTCKLLNVALSWYRWVPLVYSGAGRLTVKERAVTVYRGQWAPWERGAVGTLLDLAKKPGELSRLRRCSECSQWFHSIRGHQQFCGVACRRRHAAQDPAFREKRAAYMREQYRPRLKELQTRPLTFLKKTRQSKGKEGKDHERL